jgi:pyruvate kinase
MHIVATLGPASCASPEALVAAGASRLRLNASHMSPESLRLVIDRVREGLPTTPIVVDLQGAKMRLGSFEARSVEQGETIRFTLEGDDPTTVPLPHPEIFGAVREGQTLSLDDDRIHLTILAHDATSIDARASEEALLRPRKGINLVDHPVELRGRRGIAWTNRVRTDTLRCHGAAQDRKRASVATDDRDAQ